ncbi:MAG: hypothetical protein KJO07_02925 [Deltaproteobacteria bacterium]|nr:hypothetical protein [Deltaproteobacteria bacterium]
MIGVREFARRVAVPTAAIWVLESKVQGAVRSRLAKLRGLESRAELFVGLGDPYAPLALAVMAEVVDERRVDYQVYPVFRYGASPKDHEPMRRRYAVLDARRLAARRGIVMNHDQPIDVDRVETLTYWVEAARVHGKHRALLARLVTRLWAEHALPDYGELYAIYQQEVGAPPPRNLLTARHRVRQNEARLRRRGLWSSSSLWLEGKTFFAHERRGQIDDYLEELGA